MNIFENLKSRRFARGYSLIEVILALAMVSVVTLVAGNVMVSSRIQEQRSSVVSELERIHLTNVQRSRNPNFLRQFVYSIAGRTVNGTRALSGTGGQTTNNNLLLCLTAKKPSGGCATYDQTNAQGSTFNDDDISSEYRSSIQIRRICTDAGCPKVQVDVRTRDKDSAEGEALAQRHSVGFIPGYAFVDNVTTDFTCGANIMSALNYYQLDAECGNPTGNFTCAGGNRLMNVGNGTTRTDLTLCGGMAQEDCRNAGEYGVDYSGILINQQTCQGPADPTITSRCTASWVPRDEDQCLGSSFSQSDGCGNTRTSTGVRICSPPVWPTTTMTGYVPPPTTAPPATTTTTTPGPTTTTAPGILYTATYCFVAGTPVNMADGSQKRIEEIRVGDQVLAYDEVTSQVFVSPVTVIQHHEARLQMFYRFELENGAQFTSNGEHMIFVPAFGGYFSAKEIYTEWTRGFGLSLLHADRRPIRIKNIFAYSDVAPTYNFHVAGLDDDSDRNGKLGRAHNYYVDGVLVHNLKCYYNDPVTGLCESGPPLRARATCDTSRLRWTNIQWLFAEAQDDHWTQTGSSCCSPRRCGSSCPADGGDLSICVDLTNAQESQCNSTGSVVGTCQVHGAYCWCEDAY